VTAAGTFYEGITDRTKGELMEPGNYFKSIDHVAQELASAQYIADRALATVVFLAHRLQKPLFLEGEPGVGKTEVGTVMAKVFNTSLIRLQCYEGLDASAALYEWNYPKQLLYIRLAEQEKKRENLDEDVVRETLGCILKYQDDIKRFNEEIWSDRGKSPQFLEGRD
jgi:MoxR-like ATPase